MPRLKKKVSRDFTTIHNVMIRDMRLGATARGVLVTMLSLPENWDFSIRGLTAILPDGYTKISNALRKLEECKYLKRERVYCNGKICDWDYTFSDEPMEDTEEPEDDFSDFQETDFQEQQNLETENLIQGSQQLENHCDNKIKNNQIKNNQVYSDQESTNQSFDCTENSNEKDGLIDRYMREQQIYTEVVKSNIEYDDYVEWINLFSEHSCLDVDELDEIVEMIVRAICSPKKSERICGQEFPREVIKAAMLKVDRTCLDNAVDVMRETDDIRNFEKYLISTLFNEANGRHFKENAEERNAEYAVKRDFGRY
jgi:hypothetical protein